MSNSNLSRRARRFALAATVGASALVALPAGASAAPAANCDASALQLSLLGGAPINPIHANGGGAVCANSDGTLLTLPLLIANVQAVEANTRVTPKSKATANARVSGTTVGAGPVVTSLTGQLLSGPNSIVGQVDGLLAPVLTTVNGLLAPLNLPLIGGLIPSYTNGGVLSGLTQSLPGALTTVLPNVLDAGVIQATAQTTCSTTGVPQVSGTSQITDLKVLGTAIDANSAANRLLSIDTAHLNLGQIVSVDDILKGITLKPEGITGGLLVGLLGSGKTLYEIVNDPGGLLGTVDGILTTAGLPSIGSIVGTITGTVQPVLNSIQVDLPTGLLHAQVTPNRQTIAGDTLTQETLALSVSALSQPVLNGVIAQARVSTGSAGCVDAKQVKDPDKYTSPEAEAYLQCEKNPIALIDVYGTGSRTYVQGVAEKRFVGKTASIYLTAGKKKVGTAKVGSDGLFSKKVALPPAKIRNTNKARYYAVIDGKKTSALKFSRRMLTTGLTASSQSVTFRGRVVAPLERKQKAVTIKQRVTCKSYKTVATVKPDSKGRFTVKIDTPTNLGAAIYRAQSRVIKTKRSSKLYPTFTLPRVVGLT